MPMYQERGGSLPLLIFLIQAFFLLNFLTPQLEEFVDKARSRPCVPLDEVLRIFDALHRRQNSYPAIDIRKYGHSIVGLEPIGCEKCARDCQRSVGRHFEV